MHRTMYARWRSASRSQSGAFDLPSIVVGVVVVGILTVGVLVAVFGVIPWAQDESAKQDLVSVRTAEGVAKTKGNNGFLDSADLAAATYLPLSEGVKVAADDKGACYTGVAKSGSGKLFYSTNKTNQPIELTSTTMTHPVPGCLPAAEASDLVDDAGGYDDSYFDELGVGAGTAEQPGQAVKEAAPETNDGNGSTNGTGTDESGDPTGGETSTPEEGTDPNPDVSVVDLTVTDRTVTVDFENTSSTNDYRVPYLVHVACRDAADGSVTVEKIEGYFDLNSNIISGLSLVACIPGTTIIDVWVPTYDWDGEVYRWRINYIYEYAEPVVRGATASATGLWCIENHGNANTIGNNVDLAQCADEDAQRWQWNGDGEVRQSTLAGKCLAVSSGKLILAECDGSAAQHFTAEDFQGPSPIDGLVQMVNKANGQCIDIPGGTLHHVQLVTNECDGTLPQSWHMPGMGDDAADVVEPETNEPTDIPNDFIVRFEGPYFEDDVYWGDQTATAMTSTPVTVAFGLQGATADDYAISWSGAEAINATTETAGPEYDHYSYVNGARGWRGIIRPGTGGFTEGTAAIKVTATHKPTGTTFTKTWNVSVGANPGVVRFEGPYFDDDVYWGDQTATAMTSTPVTVAFGLQGATADDYAISWSGAEAINATTETAGPEYDHYSYVNGVRGWRGIIRPGTGGFTEGTATITATATHRDTGKQFTKSWSLVVAP